MNAAGHPDAARGRTVERLLKEKAVAVARFSGVDTCAVAEALIAGGVRAIEITLTNPEALDEIRALRSTFGDEALIGAGSVVTRAEAAAAADAGAAFVVSPVCATELPDLCRARGLACALGGFTPTELQRAPDADADAVKLFPADKLGPGYVRAVRAPMPHLRLMPTGGVTCANAGAWLEAGAALLGVGGDLVHTASARAGDYAELTRRARTLRASIDAALKADSGGAA